MTDDRCCGGLHPAVITGENLLRQFNMPKNYCLFCNAGSISVSACGLYGPGPTLSLITISPKDGMLMHLK